VEAKFGVTVAKVEWRREGGIWDLRGLQGESIGNYDAVVASDKNLASSRFTARTGLPPPLGKVFSSFNLLWGFCSFSF
jgi:renalase